MVYTVGHEQEEESRAPEIPVQTVRPCVASEEAGGPAALRRLQEPVLANRGEQMKRKKVEIR